MFLIARMVILPTKQECPFQTINLPVTKVEVTIRETRRKLFKKKHCLIISPRYNLRIEHLPKRIEHRWPLYPSFWQEKRGSPPSNSKLIFKKSQHALANRFSKTVEMALDLAIECTGNTLFEPKIARQLRERCRNSRLDLIYSFFFKKK